MLQFAGFTHRSGACGDGKDRENEADGQLEEQVVLHGCEIGVCVLMKQKLKGGRRVFLVIDGEGEEER